MASNLIKQEIETPIFKQESIQEQEQEEEIDDFDDDFEDEEEEEESNSSDDPNKFSVTLALETPLLTTTPPTTTTTTPPPPPPSNGSSSAATTFITPPPPPTDSRKLFQRLWTDEDEIGLLQGFLDFTTQRGTLNSSYHHETGPFYDHIKTKLQLDFNKNQLVEKLRRLKKKYRNAVGRVSNGKKELVFKTPHDQVTFEISKKIWSGGGGSSSAAVFDEAGVDSVEVEESNHLNSSVGTIASVDLKNNDLGISGNNSDKKMTPRRRTAPAAATTTTTQKRAAEEDLGNLAEKKAYLGNLGNSNMGNLGNSNSGNSASVSSIQNVIEETMRSCLSPLIKEMVNCVNSNGNGSGNLGFGFGGVGLSLNSLQMMNSSFVGGNSISSMGGEVMDEKWRKQQILELEVYSKRIELVQDQIKSALGELRSSMDSK